jgi:hypothetical protein
MLVCLLRIVPYLNFSMAFLMFCVKRLSMASRRVTMADVQAKNQARWVADKASISHVVAVEAGVFADVTRRYVSA